MGTSAMGARAPHCVRRECQIFCVRGFREVGSVVGSRISRTPPSNAWWPTKAGQRALSRPLAAEGARRNHSACEGRVVLNQEYPSEKAVLQAKAEPTFHPELWAQHPGILPPTRHLCWSHSQRQKTRRPPSEDHKVRVRYQPQDRQGARSYHPGNAISHGRRGHSMNRHRYAENQFDRLPALAAGSDGDSPRRRLSRRPGKSPPSFGRRGARGKYRPMNKPTVRRPLGLFQCCWAGCRTHCQRRPPRSSGLVVPDRSVPAPSEPARSATA